MREMLLAVLLASAFRFDEVAHAQGPTGTYAMWLCRGTCSIADTATAPVAGILVLFDAPVAIDTLKFPEFRKALFDSIFLLRPGSSPNACFRLTRRTAKPQLMAGIFPVGFTHWATRGDSIAVLLFASPDAFSTVSGRILDGRLTGGDREDINGRDRVGGDVHGLRLGPPDLQHCRPT